MSQLSGFQNMSVERVTGLAAVRRVERDKGADEFSRRQQDAPNRQSAQDDANEEQEDVVDVSREYRTANLPVVISPSGPTASSAASPERHIDISG